MMRKTFMILIVILLVAGLVALTSTINMASPASSDGIIITPPSNTGTLIVPILAIVAMGLIIAGIEYARRKLFCGTSNTGLDGMIASGRTGPPDDRDEMSIMIMNDINHWQPRRPAIGGVLAA